MITTKDYLVTSISAYLILFLWLKSFKGASTIVWPVLCVYVCVLNIWTKMDTFKLHFHGPYFIQNYGTSWP